MPTSLKHPRTVILAKAGIQEKRSLLWPLDPRFREDDNAGGGCAGKLQNPSKVVEERYGLNLLEIFRGTWKFERTVSSPAIVMRGEANLTPLDPFTRRYFEKGCYSLKDSGIDFYQNRFFVISETTLFINKENGELLHQFDFGDSFDFPLEASHTHPCREDSYHCHLTLLSPTQFQTFYVILGPQKRTEILSIFQRKS